MNTNYNFLAWDNDKMTNSSFNNLSFNPSHPDGPLALRNENKPFGTILPTEIFQQIGANDKDGKLIFIGSILKFSHRPEDDNDIFYNSNLGKAILRGEFIELIAVVKEKQSGFLGFDIEFFYLQEDGTFQTKAQFFTEPPEVYLPEDDDGELYSETSRDETFLRYLLGKDAIRIIGHIKETPELVPKNNKI